MNSMSLLASLLLLCVVGVSALGHIATRPPCTPKEGVVLYLDRWEKRDCVGLSLPGGTTTFSQTEGVYGHTITVPSGYEVVIHKTPLFTTEERVDHYDANTSRFVSYFWDTPITRITVTRTATTTIS
jgi:hypothetical protein